MAAHEHIDAIRIARRAGRPLRRQFVDELGDGLGPAILKGVLEVGRRNINDFDVRQFRMARADEAG